MNCFHQISFGLITSGAMGFASAEELVTPPPMLRAGNVAYQDFVQRLAGSSNNNRAYVRHLDNIENYEITIKKTRMAILLHLHQSNIRLKYFSEVVVNMISMRILMFPGCCSINDTGKYRVPSVTKIAQVFSMNFRGSRAWHR